MDKGRVNNYVAFRLREIRLQRRMRSQEAARRALQAEEVGTIGDREPVARPAVPLGGLRQLSMPSADGPPAPDT